MNKTIIAPIVAIIALAVQFVLGIEIPDAVLNEVIVTIGNVILVGATVVGVVKNHKKEEIKK